MNFLNTKISIINPYRRSLSLVLRKRVTDIRSRFPDAHVEYDEENEEIMASSKDCKQCYGKWSKKEKGFPGVSFFKARNLPLVTKHGTQLKTVKDDEKKKDDRHSEFSALL